DNCIQKFTYLSMKPLRIEARTLDTGQGGWVPCYNRRHIIHWDDHRRTPVQQVKIHKRSTRSSGRRPHTTSIWCDPDERYEDTVDADVDSGVGVTKGEHCSRLGKEFVRQLVVTC